MVVPNWYFDGVKKRIYEVPAGASFTLLGGFRVYDGGTALEPILSTMVQKDLWSRWIDFTQTAPWAFPAFSRSGGNLRPTGEYASVDFQLLTSLGWRIVLANYPHESIFFGNLFSEGTDSLFDNSRLTVQGIVPRLQGSANLLTFITESGGSTYTVSEIADAVWNKTLPA